MSARIYLDTDMQVVVNPTGLNIQSDGDPATTYLYLGNELQNTQDVSFTASVDVAWVTLNGTSGSFNWNNPYTMEVDIDPTGLDDGEHAGTITITTDEGDIEVPITLVLDTE